MWMAAALDRGQKQLRDKPTELHGTTTTWPRPGIPSKRIHTLLNPFRTVDAEDDETNVAEADAVDVNVLLVFVFVSASFQHVIFFFTSPRDFIYIVPM